MGTFSDVLLGTTIIGAITTTAIFMFTDFSNNKTNAFNLNLSPYVTNNEAGLYFMGGF